MATRGFLIRFIDIGLIVLFGFLMISDIEASSRVELGGTTEEVEEPVEEQDDQSFILVEIAADGSFIVGEAPEAQTEPRESGETSDDADPSVAVAQPSADPLPSVRVTNVGALEEAVDALHRRNEAAGVETVVLIEPHPASAVQRTVDAMDVADRLGIPKSLRMDIEVVGGGAAGNGEGEAP